MTAIVFAVLLMAIASNPVAVSSASSASVDDRDKSRPVDLWEAAIAAKGGRERLRSVNSLYMAVEQPGGDRAYYLYVFPDREFTYLYGAQREDTVINIYNGQLGVNWWQPGNHPAQFRRSKPENMDDIGLKRAQFTLMLATRWLEPKPMRARKDWLGLKRVDVVETDADGWRVDYYLDPKTHLPVKVVSASASITRDEGNLNYEVKLEDYEEINGVMMPRKVTHTTTYTRSTRKWTERVRYEINPGYSDKVFEQGPTSKMGPEVWRQAAKQ